MIGGATKKSPKNASKSNKNGLIRVIITNKEKMC